MALPPNHLSMDPLDPSRAPRQKAVEHQPTAQAAESGPHKQEDMAPDVPQASCTPTGVATRIE